ncbi:hypothetical protein QA601_17445 [Chitinispirillales bacterium ANBcel5]|uniref:hypothetical protein n=1 Tax=Cellulosispirillum alkaliphilum TaxID=3039283 RepID=UPI002A587353|nr:hypothetical protein [Chitinispirillales bacterium ANBcel5]
MAKWISAALLFFMVFGCGSVDEHAVTFMDGTYRGAFFDRGVMEINVEFELKSDTLSDIRFRYLKYKGVDYLDDESEESVVVREQYRQLADYLRGENLSKTLEALHYPANIITKESDGLTVATIRSGKLISALRDALNRGVYRK